MSDCEQSQMERFLERELSDNAIQSICEKEKCKNMVVWSFGYGDCTSCKLIGQSEGITEYPKDCLHLSKMSKL